MNCLGTAESHPEWHALLRTSNNLLREKVQIENSQ